MLTRVAVVVPAHDEQDRLPHCLAALRAAATGFPGEVELIVVADDCTDATAVLTAAAGVQVLRIAAGNVGRARAAGMAYALRHGTAGLWLATTDADSQVRPDWLGWHARHAARGTEVLAGTVEVRDWTPWPVAVRHAYEGRYRAALTGARRSARAPAGFAAHLASVADEVSAR